MSSLVKCLKLASKRIRRSCIRLTRLSRFQQIYRLSQRHIINNANHYKNYKNYKNKFAIVKNNNLCQSSNLLPSLYCFQKRYLVGDFKPIVPNTLLCNMQCIDFVLRNSGILGVSIPGFSNGIFDFNFDHIKTIDGEEDLLQHHPIFVMMRHLNADRYRAAGHDYEAVLRSSGGHVTEIIAAFNAIHMNEPGQCRIEIIHVGDATKPLNMNDLRAFFKQQPAGFILLWLSNVNRGVNHEVVVYSAHQERDEVYVADPYPLSVQHDWNPYDRVSLEGLRGCVPFHELYNYRSGGAPIEILFVVAKIGA